MSATIIKPIVGEGATISYCADSYPQTIIEVSNDLKTIVVQEDDAKCDPNSQPMTNQWIISRNTNGVIKTFTLRKNGVYVLKGDSINSGIKLSVGGRHKYYSYEF
jgi:hypothetical protein